MIRQNGKIVPEFRIERVKRAEHVDFIHFQFCQKKKKMYFHSRPFAIVRAMMNPATIEISHKYMILWFRIQFTQKISEKSIRKYWEGT